MNESVKHIKHCDQDYIQWLQQQDLSKAEAFWKQTLKGFTAPTPLVVARAMGGEHSQESSYGEEESRLSEAVTSALKSLAQEHKLTLNTLIQGAWALLLNRYSGEEDVVFGATRSCRPSVLEGAESRVGLFINTLPVRVRVSPDTSLIPWLQELRAQEINLQDYEHIPLSKVQEWSEIPDGRALFESLVVFEDDSLNSALQEQDNSWENREFQINKQTRFWMTLYVQGERNELSLRLVYQRSRCAAEHIACFLKQFQYLLEQFIAAPEKPIRSYSLVTPESQPLLPNPDVVLPEPKYESVTALFASWVKRSPEQPAICQGDRTWTYSELAQSAEELARVLLARGVERGDVVAVFGSRSFGLIASMMAVFLSGAALLTIDRNLPSNRQQVMLREAKAKYLVYLGTQQPEDEWIQEVVSVDIIGLDPDKGRVSDSQKGSNLEAIHLPELHPDDKAYIFFTSGTTGVPKGVLGCHKGISHFLHWQRQTFAIGPQDRVAQLISLSFDALLRDVFLPLTSGATLCLPEDADNLGLVRIIPWLEREKISLLHTVPAVAQSWLVNVPSGVSLRALRWMFLAGEPLTEALVQQWRKAFPDAGEIVNLYGPTETTMTKCFYRVPSKLQPGVQPLGTPLPETQALILRESNQLCGIGELGEIVLRTPFRTLGYINAPAENQKRFVKNPFRDDEQDLLYYTGDLGRYRPDGSLEILGRLDDQVKIRGVRIEIGEIEAVLVQHPAVRQTVILAREHIPGDKRLVAYVVPHQESVPTSSELRGFLKEQLPEYMVPSAFVLLDEMPLMPNGKVNRRALPAPDWSEREETFVAPRNAVEEVLCSIWSQVLGFEQVGIHDNFFELGGHSLLATQVISRLPDTFGVELSVRSLFESPTVAALAETIEASRQSGQNQKAPSILNVSRDADLPLSFGQQRLWFIEQLDPGNFAYNMFSAMQLRGLLNVAILEHSLNEIIRRHESLRTTFVAVDGRPIQVIAPALTLTLSVVDLEKLPETERSAQAQRLTTEEAQRTFDLTSGPLIRAQLLRLAQDEHLFLLTVHHIVSDGWSSGVFMKELAALYEAFSSDLPSPLPELPIQYADFAHWQQQWLQGKILEEQLGYWKQHLGGSLPVLELPTDRPRPAVQTYRGAKQPLLLPKELSEALKALSRREGVTLFMTLLAAFQTLLYRYSGQEDIIVGSPIAGRNRSEIEELIGFFVNSLVLRTDMSGNPSFRELLSRVREVALGAYAHQDLPVEKLVQELHLERDLSQNRLFQVMLILQNAPMPALEFSGLTLNPLVVDNETAKFDVTLDLADKPSGIGGWFEYNTDLFDECTLRRLAEHFQILLEGIVANPEQRLMDLPLLTPAERHTLLVEWNNIHADYPKDLCIHQLFETQVERTPDAVAVVFEDQQLTYRELNCRANQLAHHLRSLGVKPEVFVGLYMERSLETIVGLLGILKAGGAYVPIDPTYSKERLTFMLEDTNAPVLLTQARLMEGLPSDGIRVICLDTEGEAIDSESQENPVCSATAENLAYVIYTSGSTGQPKGVMIQHRSLVNFTESASVEYEIKTSDRILQFASISFDASGEEIYPCLTRGAALVLRTDTMLDTVSAFLQKCQDWAITVLDLPTAYWHELTARLSTESEAFPPSLRLVIIGGEKALPERLATWHKQVGERIRLVNTYGPTEATVVATLCELSRDTQTELDVRELPIGRAIRNLQTYVLDQYLQPVPIGVPGELHIGGAGLARGYLNRPDLTDSKFIPNPFSDEPEARLYKTGDLVRYRPDGNIEFLGRIDFQVKIRGFRIELGEIETVLGQHPAVWETVVIAREDVPGDKRLVAYIVLSPEFCNSSATATPLSVESDSELTQQNRELIRELRNFLKEKLPNYMVPSAFVILEALPLTPNGKVDRRTLPAPDASWQSLEAGLVAPRTPTEEVLAPIWGEVLKLERVGIHDNFFELGGHSLLATQIISRCRSAFAIELPLRKLFERPTIAELAEYIETVRWIAQDLEATTSGAVVELEEIEL